MARLTWDKEDERLWETGVDHCVLYTGKSSTAGKSFETGNVWNGISKIDEKPTGGDPNDIYADNIKYASLRAVEKFDASVEAYMYPNAFAECDGSAEPVTGVYVGQQKRKPFGLSYRTDCGDASDSSVNVEEGYKIHLIWNATASPSERSYQTINESPELSTFSWDLTTTPVILTSTGPDGKTLRPTASMVIDSRKFTTDEQKAKLAALENILYGTDAAGSQNATEPYLPTPDVVLTTLGYTAPTT